MSGVHHLAAEVDAYYASLNAKRPHSGIVYRETLREFRARVFEAALAAHHAQVNASGFSFDALVVQMGGAYAVEPSGDRARLRAWVQEARKAGVLTRITRGSYSVAPVITGRRSHAATADEERALEWARRNFDFKPPRRRRF